MAALVAAALCQIGDRPAWLAAILADRYRRPGTVIAAAALALAFASAAAVLAGTVIAPRLTPDARQLLLACALGLQGGGAFFSVKAPDRLSGWRLGAFATSLTGLAILLLGDGMEFVVFALAIRSPVPALAAVGATLGALAILAPAASIGEAAWLKLPQRPARRAIGALFVIAAAALALGAFGLI